MVLISYPACSIMVSLPSVLLWVKYQEHLCRLQRERAQASAASVFLEGGWLNPELGDAFGNGADLAITFPEAQLGPPSQGGSIRYVCQTEVTVGMSR